MIESQLMNNDDLIKGVCNADIAIKAEMRVRYFKIVRDFVDHNNRLNKSDVLSNYIYNDVVGLINMKFTSSVRNNTLQTKLLDFDFGELVYYLTKKLFETELRILPKRGQKKLGKHKAIQVKIEDTKEDILYNPAFEKLFKELVKIREKELGLLKKVMASHSMDEFQVAYFDLALDIINKNRHSNQRITDLDVTEYAKDIFGEAVLKLVTLIQEKRYVYEARISSFLYWPMFNKWAKLSKELGFDLDEELIERLPDDDKLYFETSLERQELKAFLNENIEKLGGKEKLILWLKEAEGYSYQEIKEKFNLEEEVNYLKQIKLRGKRSLESKLKEDRRYKELFTV